MSHSRKLLDHWLPPEGVGKPLGCLATTFTFDPDFFESECIARFVGLDSKRGEGDDISDLAFLIDQEEKLSETRVGVVVDRSYNAEARSLRWDILPVGIPGGIQHSKVTLLVWERLVRLVVGSANLTPAGYRSSVEAAVALDAFEGSQLPESLFRQGLQILRQLAGRAPGSASESGPKSRALATVRTAEQIVERFRLPIKGPARSRLAIVAAEPGKPALKGFDAVWRRGPPRQATVISPFFEPDAAENHAAEALAERLAVRGQSSVAFIIPVDGLDEGNVARAPASLSTSFRRQTRIEFYRFDPPQEERDRKLHAKAIILKSDWWIAAQIGSSNFTASGLCTQPGYGNLEVNFLIGAPLRSKVARELSAFFTPYVGERLALEGVHWEPPQAEDEPVSVQLPEGFLDALLEPGPPSELWIRLRPARLPERWRISLPTGELLLDDGIWEDRGRPKRIALKLKDGAAPFFLETHWKENSEWLHVGWPVNVTEPGRLAPPDELRDLPAEALLQALASVRPIHEGIAHALRRAERIKTALGTEDLDPLRRYSGSGRLLHRARQVSFALAGLRRRLERPASSLDAMTWRLKGPFGPKALAEKLAQAAKKDRALAGETDFLIAELALTLKRADWRAAARRVSLGKILPMVREVLEELRQQRDPAPIDPQLRAYVDRAFEEAQL